MMKPLCVAALALVLGACAPKPDPRVQALEDRARIEELLMEYYGSLGTSSHDYANYFTADALLDVNGQVAHDHEGIEGIYKSTAERTGVRNGTFRMVLTNLRVQVDGDKATASMIWTGVHSESVTAVPQVAEQGTEQDELVKVDGRWLFSKRIVTSDGGMPEALLPDYLKRTQH